MLRMFIWVGHGEFMLKQYLLNAKNVILTPHIAGWTIESHERLAQVIVDKIKALY